LLDFGNFPHHLAVPAYPQFPELSRAPALRTKTTSIDPTIRDSFENGMASSRARFTRRRRRWTVSLDFLTNDDVSTLEAFVQQDAVYGANIFIFPDNRDPANPQELLVRFEVIPAYTDAGWYVDQFRQDATFEIGEV
jgi:hypothetical protein